MFLLFQFIATEVNFSRFQKSSTYDNYTYRAFDTLFTSNVYHVSMCLSLCLKLDTCYSVFFNEEQKLCRGCNVMYSSRYLPVEDTGSHYYHVAPGMSNTK